MERDLAEADLSELHVRLRTARLTAGLTQKDVADHLNRARTTVLLWETDDARRRTVPDLKTLEALAALFNRPIKWLVDAPVQDPATTKREKEIQQILSKVEVILRRTHCGRKLPLASALIAMIHAVYDSL